MFYPDPPIDLHARRTFLKRSCIAASTMCCSRLAYAFPPPDDGAHPLNCQSTDRGLRLVNDGSGEILDVVYWRDNQYIADNVGQLNYFMRDLHVNKSFLMDLKLYDFLYTLHKALNVSERIHVLSGYRTAATNAELRKKLMGAALRSFHVSGRAVDFYIPGHDLQDVQKAARHLVLGGVGYYPKAGFVHIDTGYPRHWKQAS